MDGHWMELVIDQPRGYVERMNAEFLPAFRWYVVWSRAKPGRGRNQALRSWNALAAG